MATLTLTKLVKHEWDIARSEARQLAGRTIIDRYVAEEKSDGVGEEDPDVEFGGMWKFVDQAAAEEYLAEITASDLAAGRILLSSSITDI